MKKDNLQNFNNLIKKHISNNSLDYTHFFGTINNENISITLDYSPLLRVNNNDFQNDSSFIGLSSNGNPIQRTDIDNYYYGLSPVISGELITKKISELAFKDLTGLDTFINDYHHEFMLNLGQEKYLKSLARYLTISLTYNYAVCFSFKEDIFTNSCFIEGIDYQFDQIEINKKMIKVCYIIGCPSQKMIDFLQDYRFIKNNNIIYETNIGNTFEEIYQYVDNINLYNTTLFYSGVLIRPLYIKKLTKHDINKDVTSYKISFERSTYATVYGMDCLKALKNPLLKDDITLINDFFELDDEIMKKYLVSDLTLDYLNCYLQNSNNVHQIGISANIITNDDILLFSVRGKNSIDSEKQGKMGLYPGSNGNAEILSNEVPFYKYSVNEDLPTINLSDVRLDCNKELSRESYAELKIALDPMKWDYYGFCICGSVNGYIKDDIRYRRMHFNIQAKQSIDNSFKNIYTLQKQATENYETSEIRGLKLIIHKNFLSKIFDKILNSLKIISKGNTLYKACLSLLTLIFASKNIKDGGFSLSVVGDLLSLLIAIASSILLIVDVIKKIKLISFIKKKVKFFSLLMKKTDNKEKIINYYVDNYKPHPATMTILCLHIFETYSKKSYKQ